MKEFMKKLVVPKKKIYGVSSRAAIFGDIDGPNKS